MVLDGVEVGGDGNGGTGSSHVGAVVVVVHALGAQDLALSDVLAEAAVAVGHAGHTVGAAHELQLVDVAQDDVLTVGQSGSQGEALGAVGSAVSDVQGQLVGFTGELDSLVLLGVAGSLSDGVQVAGGVHQGGAGDQVNRVLIAGSGGELVDGLAHSVVLDGVEVGVDGDGGAGAGHILAVVSGVLALGSQDLALGVAGAEVGVAVGHAGHAVSSAHELEFVQVSGNDDVVLDNGHGISKALVTVGGGVGLADLQAALDLDVGSGLGSLGRSSSLRRSGGLLGDLLAHGAGHGLAHGVAGDGSAADAVDLVAVGVNDLLLQLLQGSAADVGGLAVAGQGAGGDGAVLHGQGGGDVAAKALGGAGQGLSRRGSSGAGRAAAASRKAEAQCPGKGNGKNTFHHKNLAFYSAAPPGRPGRPGRQCITCFIIIT